MNLENVKFWTEGVEVEQEAIDQLRKISSMPILAGHIAVMPDVHMGVGATVGSVIPTFGAVIPSAVGVDIGCGMAAAQTSLKASDLPESLSGVRSAIEKAVPVGFAYHQEAFNPAGTDTGARGQELHARMKELYVRFQSLAILDQVGHLDRDRVWKQCGTLGGGNHFIELCLDEHQNVWVMLHSGSRNVGKTIGEVAITMARQLAEERGLVLPDRDLGWLQEGTAEFDMYITAMLWAQEYASLNRDLMYMWVLQALRKSLGRDFDIVGEHVNCHHNFTQLETHGGKEVWITRKGAVQAKEGQLGIIPGSMGARSYIVRGLGNQEAYCSCSHGAGRRLSRSKAKKLFSLDDLAAQTAGVECRKDEGVLDEAPGSYKDIDAVMAAQTALVESIRTLKQVLCVKG